MLRACVRSSVSSMSVRPPAVRRVAFIPCPRIIYCTGSVSCIGLHLVLQTRPASTASCCSCSSGREFASGFLQTPLRNGRPCPWLVVGHDQPPLRTCTVKLRAMRGTQKSTCVEQVLSFIMLLSNDHVRLISLYVRECTSPRLRSCPYLRCSAPKQAWAAHRRLLNVPFVGV